jgi:hypothetical protein
MPLLNLIIQIFPTTIYLTILNLGHYLIFLIIHKRKNSINLNEKLRSIIWPKPEKGPARRD